MGDGYLALDNIDVTFGRVLNAIPGALPSSPPRSALAASSAGEQAQGGYGGHVSRGSPTTAIGRLTDINIRRAVHLLAARPSPESLESHC